MKWEGLREPCAPSARGGSPPPHPLLLLLLFACSAVLNAGRRGGLMLVRRPQGVSAVRQGRHAPPASRACGSVP